MTAVETRVATEDEREALQALQTRASLANPGDRDALVANPDAIEVPVEQLALGQVFVAEVGGEIRGFAALVPRHDGAVEVDALFVEPTEWRRGIGRALIGRLAEEASKAGAAALHVVGNPHAEGFYAALGFEVIGEQATRFGVGLLMRKPIERSVL